MTDHPETIPTDYGDLRPSKAEYRRAAEAATELGADDPNEGAGAIVWGVLSFLIVALCAAVVLIALRGGK